MCLTSSIGRCTSTRQQDFYADPDNQAPQGPARCRTAKLSGLVPVRFPPQTLAKIRDAADADDRSVSAWIRLAVDRELERSTTNKPAQTAPTRWATGTKKRYAPLMTGEQAEQVDDAHAVPVAEGRRHRDASGQLFDFVSCRRIIGGRHLSIVAEGCGAVRA